MSQPELVVEQEFQYPNLHDQSGTAVAAMWLFITQECLFFGVMMLTWVYSRYWNQAGFDAGSHLTVLWIGSINAGVLITSSYCYAMALAFIRSGRPRLMNIALGFVVALGLVFLCLKLYEWHLDFTDHVWINDPAFPIHGELEGGAKLFWAFYWMSTVLHGFHMTVGIGLVTWILWRSFHGHFSTNYHTPVEVVGLYWSFVDIVWVMLWPMLYLIGRMP